VDARIKALRCKLAKVRLARLEVQRKQWKVTELKQAWMEKLQGIQLERTMALERRASVASNDSICLRQLDAFAQVRCCEGSRCVYRHTSSARFTMRLSPKRTSVRSGISRSSVVHHPASLCVCVFFFSPNPPPPSHDPSPLIHHTYFEGLSLALYRGRFLFFFGRVSPPPQRNTAERA